MLTVAVAANTSYQFVLLGDVFFSVSFGFFQRGMKAMMTFLGLGFGFSIFALSGSLVILLLPCFKPRPLIEAIRNFIMLSTVTAGAQSYQII
jgi:hypothetical protein